MRREGELVQHEHEAERTPRSAQRDEEKPMAYENLIIH
jgi:hypothetical protein